MIIYIESPKAIMKYPRTYKFIQVKQVINLNFSYSNNTQLFVNNC